MMTQKDKETVIAQTKKWVTDVVIACNFCPFAAREVKRNSIAYEVLENADAKSALQAVAQAFVLLENEPDIETFLLILPHQFTLFNEYLDLVELAEALLEKEDYEGVYQIASFHPEYMFAGTNESDPSNFTNRSPYPMLHFLREDSVSAAVDSHPDISEVPENNIAFTQEKGLVYMSQLLASCLQDFNAS
jgi:hypothetical protein